MYIGSSVLGMVFVFVLVQYLLFRQQTAADKPTAREETAND
jgi:hypothetical protein